MAAHQYDSLFIQDDEPLESLQPKRKRLPFEECSSSSSEGEPDTPRQPVLARKTKPPLILTTRTYGNQYRPPAPSSTVWRASDDPEKHAEDIKRTNQVLDAAWKRRAARSPPYETADEVMAQHTAAPTPHHRLERHPEQAETMVREVVGSERHASGREGRSRPHGVENSAYNGRQSPIVPQRSRDGAKQATKRARLELDAGETKLSTTPKKHIREAGSTLFGFFEEEDV
ncbi:hypothetical protein LTR85_011807 [Meristemomyces frigidus]|nr:hypothetical protein LTR85_011807 [Meristemomyces frigidus]